MVTIDGKTIDLDINKYSNFEEVLVVLGNDSALADRIVTDVFLNGALFSELYPHQAEDIACSEVQSVEIKSMPMKQMALEITGELFKVITLMIKGSKTVARLFRQADDDNALELLQDTLDVAKDFMKMLGVVRTYLGVEQDSNFNANVDTFSSLLSEMVEVLQSEDWILLADLLEFEFVPVCENWNQTISNIQAQQKAVAE